MEVYNANQVQVHKNAPPPPPPATPEIYQATAMAPPPKQPAVVLPDKPPEPPKGQTSEITIDQAPPARPTPPAPAKQDGNGILDILNGIGGVLGGLGDLFGHDDEPEPRPEGPTGGGGPIYTPPIELPKVTVDEEPVEPIPQEPEPLPEPEPVAEPEPVPEPEPEAEPDPEPVTAEGRTFKTQGDPIVKTGDGLQFSANKDGKYVSLQSESGDFLMEQQVSTTKDNRHYNTAMGFKLGEDTVKFDTANGTKAASMSINGQSIALGNSAKSGELPGGGSWSYDPKTNKVNMTSAEGDQVTVNRAYNAAKTNYLNATVTMAESRPAGSVYGMLGNMDADNDASNDARMRDGSAFQGAIGDLWKTPEAYINEWKTKPGEGVL